MITKKRRKSKNTLVFEKEAEKLSAHKVFGISVDNPYATWRYFNVVGLGIDADTSDTSSDTTDSSHSMNIDTVERNPVHIASTDKNNQPIQSSRLKETELMQLPSSKLKETELIPLQSSKVDETRFTASDKILININEESLPPKPFSFVYESKIFSDLWQIDWKKYLEMDFED
ncbi:21232_t:CDS:2 [Cetraspora pellucida]|uniref:21232_t:CDS:1 n=1 Tax=Cetraspora pellucida TaxID=1433469 RepID=A0A9N8WMD0_9GLOM|nr:21232_t:CDS:2 [Cetraspora pellucida]